MSAIYRVLEDKAFGYNKSKRNWSSVSLPASFFNRFLNEYHLMEVGIEDFFGNPYTFDPIKHHHELARWEGSLQEWFDSKKGIAINDLVEGLPKLEFVESYFQPISYNLEIKYNLTPKNTHPTQDFPLDDATDVVISVPKDSHHIYSKGVMYLVDGLWHPHKHESYGVRIIGAGTTIRTGGGNNISGLVLKDIGDVKTYPMSSLTFNKVQDDRPLCSSLTIKLPESISGKTVGLVCGGVLEWIDGSKLISDTSFMYSFSETNMYQRLIATQDRIDWEHLGIGQFDNPQHVKKIRSDAVLSGIMNHYSCFVVVVDNSYFEYTTEMVSEMGCFGRYYRYDPEGNKPLGYLVNEQGMAVDYWPVWERRAGWTLHTKEGGRPNLMAEYSGWHNQTLVNDAVVPENPFSSPQLRMIHIRAKKK